MKKFWRILTIAMVVTILMSVVAMAAPTGTTEYGNNKMTVYGYNGAVAEFTGDDAEFTKLTYTSADLQPGGMYLLLMLKSDNAQMPSEGPTEQNILYIDQQTASNDATPKVVFETVYPSSLQDSVLVIVGVDKEGKLLNTVCAIVNGQYVIGDANGDGKVSIQDVIRIANYLVGNATLNKDAADANGDSKISIQDVIRIANYLVGNAVLG